MGAAQLRVVDDLAPTEWIAPRLGGRFGAAGLTVPRGFSAYARICHPATDTAGQPVAWSKVAEATGRRPHALMQWHAIVGSSDPLNMTGSLWDGADPPRGNLARSTLIALCDRLAESSNGEPDCYFCLWEGYGGLDEYGWLETNARPCGQVDDQDRHLLAEEDIRLRPRLHLPDRDYVVLAGPLRAGLRIGSFGLGIFWPQSPNLFWPEDRAWCVASEIDFDSTLVGGSSHLIDAILNTPALDAWPLAPEDSLAYDADPINQTPGSTEK